MSDSNRNRVFIIAEAGVNHNGDLSLARRLVDAAADAGADAVKFQTFKAANLASRRVLQKSGFRQEGEAKAYLKINGAWADHLLFGVVSDDWVRDA